MVDFFLLLLLPGAGDELQGIKNGIIEMADAILSTRPRATTACAPNRPALNNPLRPSSHPATPGWKTEVDLCSAPTGEGIPQAWRRIEHFFRELDPKALSPHAVNNKLWTGSPIWSGTNCSAVLTGTRASSPLPGFAARPDARRNDAVSRRANRWRLSTGRRSNSNYDYKN